MKLIINIDLDNDVFYSDPAVEIRRILYTMSARSVIEEAIRDGKYLNLLDINGNIVGAWKIGEKS